MRSSKRKGRKNRKEGQRTAERPCFVRKATTQKNSRKSSKRNGKGKDWKGGPETGGLNKISHYEGEGGLVTCPYEAYLARTLRKRR